MRVNFGTNAASLKSGAPTDVIWDSAHTVNGHILLVGMSGSGKTYNLKRIVRQMMQSSGKAVRVHVFDTHGDIDIPGASTVRFSEQTQYGLNPLRVNPDPHFGGVRKRVQGFIATMNRVMRALGSKQEAVLRNVLYDLYAFHGFSPDDPETWAIDESVAAIVTGGIDDRLYLDVPFADKDAASALGAQYDSERKCWYVSLADYEGAITQFPPKRLTRTHPTINDALRLVRHIYQQSFLGASQKAVSYLEASNKAAMAYRRKVLQNLRGGSDALADESLQDSLEKSRLKAVSAFDEYTRNIMTGKELDSLMKYSSTDVLKSVLDRLENLNAIGIFKDTPPPFDPNRPVWRYNINALGKDERKLFVLYQLEQIFAKSIERGETNGIVEVLVLDEAHAYTDDDPDNIINTISKEARKFGVAMLCASQSPHHFPEDFIASVATKVVLGIDEMYWQSSQRKMRVTEKALAWIVPRKKMLVQIKEAGSTRNTWAWVVNHPN